MDNRIFNVNGNGADLLVQTLGLAFRQRGQNTTAKAWAFHPRVGMVLLWATNKNHPEEVPFMTPLSAHDVHPLVCRWLEGEQAKLVELTSDWDKDHDHDGHNSRGWRVFVDAWGHVKVPSIKDPDPAFPGERNYSYAICAITPAFMWHGK